jgi:hypothetical protein
MKHLLVIIILVFTCLSLVAQDSTLFGQEHLLDENGQMLEYLEV